MNNNDFITMFEELLKDFTGAPYVVLTNSCTSAIMLMLKLKQSKSSTCPKQTYISIPQLLIRETDFSYQEEEWVGNYHICDNIYDYAVGFDLNMYKPGQYQCLSFQQKKTLNIGKGGAILLDNEEEYLILKRMSHDGRDSSIPTAHDLNNIIMGYHVYMSPDEAAKGILLLNQLTSDKIKIGTFKDYPDVSRVEY